MSSSPRQPQAFQIEPEREMKKAAPRAPRVVHRARIEFEPEPAGQELAPLPAPPPKRRWRLGALLAGSLAALVSLYAGLAITRLVEDLFQRSAMLGWAALALALLAGAAALAIIVREIWGLVRLSRIVGIQEDAARAISANDLGSAKRVIDAMKRLYAGRRDLAWGLSALAEHESAIMDPADRMRLLDRDLLSPLDAETHRIIARAARRVTLLTTVTPAAALDILFVAAQNLRMLREIATLYGGRPSSLATLRLARMVLSHLAVAGGLALSDSLLQHLLGKGLVGRLSARFGEGAVNGILTARIGLAARDVCRPIPQDPRSRETLGSLVRELLSFDEKEPKDESRPAQ
jgi:putative membrane protein